jgi:shikimate 5-dehydrogenase
VLINCTSLGTVNTDSPLEHLNLNTRLVIDLAVKPNDLTKQSSNIEYLSGTDFYKNQFFKQYSIYTGKSVDKDDYELIAAQQC